MNDKIWKVKPYFGMFKFRIIKKVWWGWSDCGHYNSLKEAKEIVDFMNTESKGE